MTLPDNSPCFRQLIRFASAGFNALGDDAQAEAETFVRKGQDKSGAFYDRAGIPDPYYSLFGFFLAEAAGMKYVLPALKAYVNIHPELGHDSLVNRCCMALIARGTGEKKLPGFTRWPGILKHLISGSGNMGTSYQLFLVFLALDAYGFNNRLFRSMLRPFLSRHFNDYEVPCPVAAASLVLNLQLGGKTDAGIQRLSDLFDEEKGFRAFPDAPEADLLSTAVALFALHLAGADLRPYKPACLSLIQDNYDTGAFLAGNGDFEKDTEYTFYGWLALGLLAD
jgi:hypothetical protein